MVKVAVHMALVEMALVDFPARNTISSIFVMRLVVLTVAQRCLVCHKRPR